MKELRAGIMKFFINIVAVVISLSVTACNSTKTAKLSSETSEVELCQQVKQLVNQHQTGFKQIKGQLQATKFMDVWEAKYQLVGKNCQIWQWSNGKQAYMCSLTVPNKEQASEKVDKAINFTKKCLGKQWAYENIHRNESDALRSIFSKQGVNTVASIHGISTKGLFKSEWTVYYLIGDRDQSL